MRLRQKLLEVGGTLLGLGGAQLGLTEGALQLAKQDLEAKTKRLNELKDEGLALKAKAKSGPAGKGAQASEDRSSPSTDVRKPAKDPFPVLSAEDINLIRVYELDLNNPPRLLIPHGFSPTVVRDSAGLAR